VTLAAPAPAAAGTLAALASGSVVELDGGRRLRAPVVARAGLATAVIRALDAAGIAVDDLEIHHPSLDDVFFALTGHPAADETDTETDSDEFEEAVA